MPQDSNKIVQLIDHLNDPDAVVQRSVMDKLVELGSDAAPLLSANIMLVNSRIRRGLVQVLGEIGDERALLPLMRYVFDQQGKFQESDGRALAMKSIIALTHGPDKRIFGFATDMIRDSDAFVRAYTIDLFAALNDRRGLPYVKDALEDADETVRERANSALPKLAMLKRSENVDSREDIVQKVLRSTGNQREFNLQELLSRPDAFSLAAALVRADQSESTAGLRALQQIDDPRARKIAAEVLLRPLELTAGQKAIGLRIIARYLTGDATSAESQLIERSLYDEDSFVRLAALSAASKSGVQTLVRYALNALQTADTLTALTVAEGFSRAPFPAISGAFSVLHDSLVNTRGRRISSQAMIKNPLSDDINEQVRLEAFLLRTIANIIETEVNPVVLERAQDQALVSLKGNSVTSVNLQPIYITALEVLERTTTSLNTVPNQTWQLSDILLLLDVHTRLDSARSRHRARQILKRVTPCDYPETVPYIQQWRSDPDISIQEDIIVMLERARCEESVKTLDELSKDRSELVRDSASAVLRRWRNDAPFIDVDFENPLKNSEE